MTETASAKTGALLINLGTPDAPTAEKVSLYLKQFLMDPYVIDIPFLARWFLIHALIVPKRSPISASQYQKVWTERGSPLLFHTTDLAPKVQQGLGDRYLVRVAMRYGNPSILDGVQSLRKAGVGRILAFPLYPQYSLAATQSSIVEVEKAVGRTGAPLPVSILPPFYDESSYLDAVTEVSAPVLNSLDFDMALFSFHGLPERQVRKTDPSRAHCLVAADCCEKIGANNRDCYRAQCYATAKHLARRLGLSTEKYRVCFQSRLGRTPWIRPYTDELYRTLPAQGVRKLAVLCPSFVADCLETLEEVTIRGNEEFRRHGGEALHLVPSLNSADVWASAVAHLVRKGASAAPSPLLDEAT